MIGPEYTQRETPGTRDRKCILGMVNYINTSPIYIPWKEMGPLDGWSVLEGYPTLLNKKLLRGEIDAGIVSSFSYGLNSDRYLLLPDLCISATGAVNSVTLLSKRPLNALGSDLIYLTPQSATSVNLLRLILELFYGLEPRYETGTFHDFMQNDKAKAYLAIGDEALRLRDRKGLFHFDLAEIWLEQTGLPFVFAVWAVRRECWAYRAELVLSLKQRLLQCYIAGQRGLKKISQQVAGRIPMSPNQCLSYLKGIELEFTVEKQRGLERFFELLADVCSAPLNKHIAFIGG